jgi:hypothetical protein
MNAADALLNYHPNRYAAQRPHAKSLLNSYRAIVGIDAPTHASLQVMQSELTRHYNDALGALPFEERPADMSVLTRELSLFMHYASFFVHGRNIFDFSAAMATMFRETDVDDVPLSVFEFPYRSFYMGFGPQADLDLWKRGYLVDGAYISHGLGRIEVLLTTWRAEHVHPIPWITSPDRYYYFPIPATDTSLTIGEAIAQHLAEAQPFSPKYFADTSGVYEVDSRAVEVVDRHKETADLVAQENREGYPTFRSALRLIVNGLCYLSAYPDDIENAYPPGTPPALLEKIARASKPKEKQRAQSKLTSMGYTKIHFCGRAMEREAPEVRGGEVSPHWRRGHWRQQPVGTQRRFRRMTWIMPTIVRRDRGEPAAGHVYLVGNVPPEH